MASNGLKAPAAGQNHCHSAVNRNLPLFSVGPHPFLIPFMQAEPLSQYYRSQIRPVSLIIPVSIHPEQMHQENAKIAK